MGIYGASGFGREVMPLLQGQCSSNTRCVFIDDAAETIGAEFAGLEVMPWDTFRASAGDRPRVVLAVSDPATRQRLAGRCMEAGAVFETVQAPGVVRAREANVGSGAVLCSFVTLTSNAQIGRQFHANIYSYVAHDCVLGDFVTLAPRASCNGNVLIEDRVYVGTGAIIKQGRPGQPLVIGKGAVIGMGAVVTKSVPPGETVVGNPARTLTR